MSGYIDETSKTRIAKVNKICKGIMHLTEEDFEAIEYLADQQMAYMHPLKMATQAKLNDLGVHNRRVAKGLRNMKAAIELLKK
jgi:hypothetical protein